MGKGVGGGGGGGGGNALPLKKVLGHHSSRDSYPTDTSPIHAPHISDMEAFGHDHVEKTTGYEHTVEGMSLKRHSTIFVLIQL